MTFTGLALVTVTGRLTMLDQRPASGHITFTTTNNPVNTHDSSPLISSPLSVEFDEAGEFSIGLPSTFNASITPVGGWVYEVAVVVAGLQRRFFKLPLSTTPNPIDLFLAAPTDTFPGIYLAGPKGDRGDEGPDGPQGPAAEDALPTPGDILYNSDGLVIADNDGNQYSYNPDGTPRTQYKNGITRFFTYADGRLVNID